MKAPFPCTSSVHPLFYSAAEISYLGIFASQLNYNIGLGIIGFNSLAAAITSCVNKTPIFSATQYRQNR